MDHRLIAVIVNDLSLTSWQAQALAGLGSSSKFLLLNCTNTPPRQRRLRHGLYSLLESIASRLPAARRRTGPLGLHIVEVVNFEAELDGEWQRLPAHVLERLSKLRPIAVVQFGMERLRLSRRLNCPLLSYRYGDPRRSRDHLPGFYEMLQGLGSVGQVIEILADTSDQGAIVAFAETRIRPYSYGATVKDVHRSSALLLKVALRNCTAGKTLPLQWKPGVVDGPLNLLAARFVAKLIMAKIRAALRRIFLQATWEVARAELAVETAINLAAFPAASTWRVYPRPRQYQFLADPFPHPSSGILVEALRSADQQGEILHIADGFTRTLCKSGGHFSYPGTISHKGEHFLVPEVALWSSPVIYRLTDFGAEAAGALELSDHPRLIDPTLYAHNGHVYLFANHLSETPNVLRLWVSDDLFSPFVEHQNSPIRMSPSGSRMGGAIFSREDRLYRIGQENTGQYGAGIVLFEITTISAASYEERQVGALSFTGVKGPHTLNFVDGHAVFDFFRVESTVLRGMRRTLGLAALPFSRR